jgi:hypothetical protein
VKRIEQSSLEKIPNAGRLENGGRSFVIWAIALHAVFAVGALRFGPMMNSDSATGFLIWDAWISGLGWNNLASPDPADIAKQTSFFHVWWAPGQYLATAPWQWLGLNLGEAIAIGGFVATVSALIGFRALFVSWGFSGPTAGWSVLALACNWTLTRTYGDYMGGETALLAVLPWVFLAATHLLSRPTIVTWLVLPALYWLGCMAKNTFTPLFAGLVAGTRFAAAWSLRGRPLMFAGELCRWIAVIAAGHTLFWFTFLRHGTSPAAGLGGPLHPDWAFSLLRLLGFPVGSLFSSGTILGRVFQHPSDPIVASLHQLWPAFVLLAMASVALMAWILWRESRARPSYAAVIGAVLLASFGFYGLVALWRETAGIDERFFKPVGFILLPGVIDAIRGSSLRWARWTVGLVLGLTCVYGVAAYANRALHLHRLDCVGARGITQQNLSREGLRTLQRLDRELPAGSLIVVPSPEMALEIRRTRWLATDAAFRGANQMQSWTYLGKTSGLFVFVSAPMKAAGQAEALLRSFRDYPRNEWRERRIDSDWSVLWQGNDDGLLTVQAN